MFWHSKKKKLTDSLEESIYLLKKFQSKYISLDEIPLIDKQFALVGVDKLIKEVKSLLIELQYTDGITEDFFKKVQEFNERASCLMEKARETIFLNSK